jgi:hypothetical protein
MSDDTTGKILQHFFYYQNLIKIFHWQTRKYAHHVASDNLYSGIQTLIDQWVEVYQGKYGIMSFENKEVEIPLKNMDIKSFISSLDKFKSFLTNYLVENLDESDTDLVNIRDEMLALVNKTLYLLTLE